jgi:hypothetical protein
VRLTKEASVSCNCFAASSVKIPSCKCCEQHLLPGGSITFCSTKAVVLHNCEITTSLEDAAKQLQLTESSFVNRTYILNMLQRMRDLCEKNETCRLDFEKTGSLSETDYCSLVGLSKQFFE